jgi:hypothetical protein
MNLEILLRLSQAAIAGGLILAALGGYGAYHFKSKIEIREQHRQRNQMSKVDKKLDQIITQNQSISKSQKEDIIRSIERAERGHLNDLKNKYNLGYALLYVDKESWYYVPRNVELSVNWFSTKIISQSKSQITIFLPDFVDKNQNRFTGNKVGLARVAGASVSPFLTGSIKVATECIDNSDEGVTIVIGFQSIKQK